MPLVAYYSSDSESETEEDATQENHEAEAKMKVETDEASASLPETNSISMAPDRKRKQPIRIMAPTLEDIPEGDDEEQRSSRRKKLKLEASRKSGLVQALPPPRKFLKKSTDLVPHTVVARKPPPVASKPLPVASKPPVATPAPAERSHHEESDDEDVPLDSNQFFTLITPSLPSLPVEVPAMPMKVSHPEEEVPMEVEHTVAPPPVPESEKDILKQFVNDPDKIPDTCLPDQLDLEVLRRLQGKTNLGKEDIQIIDVHADDQRSDPKVWLTKQLTMEKKDKKKQTKEEDLPSAMHKRKHQITYLAHQAKERELELKNQWAMNRMTRQQSQSKYGF